MNYCKKCKEKLPNSSFSKDKSRSNGLQLYCKRCISLTRYKKAGGISKKQILIELNKKLYSQGLKFCSKCEKTLSVYAFSKCIKTHSGLKCHCKKCISQIYYEKTGGFSDKTILSILNVELSSKGLKCCYGCSKHMPFSSFYKDSKTLGDLNGLCKDCFSKYTKERRTGSEKLKIHLLLRVKGNAKKRKLNFNLTLNDIPRIPKYCPMLNIELSTVIKKLSDNTLTVDRIDNSLGYIAGNIQLISWRANKIKNIGNAEELKKIAKYLEEI